MRITPWMWALSQTAGTQKPDQHCPFFMPRPEVWILADEDG